MRLEVVANLLNGARFSRSVYCSLFTFLFKLVKLFQNLTAPVDCYSIRKRTETTLFNFNVAGPSNLSICYIFVEKYLFSLEEQIARDEGKRDQLSFPPSQVTVSLFTKSLSVATGIKLTLSHDRY